MRRKTIHLKGKTLHHSVKKHIKNHGGIHRGKSVGGNILLKSIRTNTNGVNLRNPLVVSHGGVLLNKPLQQNQVHKIQNNGVKSKPIRLAL